MSNSSATSAFSVVPSILPRVPAAGYTAHAYVFSPPAVAASSLVSKEDGALRVALTYTAAQPLQRRTVKRPAGAIYAVLPPQLYDNRAKYRA